MKYKILLAFFIATLSGCATQAVDALKEVQHKEAKLKVQKAAVTATNVILIKQEAEVQKTEVELQQAKDAFDEIYFKESK